MPRWWRCRLPSKAHCTFLIPKRSATTLSNSANGYVCFKSTLHAKRKYPNNSWTLPNALVDSYPETPPSLGVFRSQDPASVPRALELAVRGITTQRQTGSCDHGLIQSARLNGHDPYTYLKDVLTRLPTQRASEITELLPHTHNWQMV